WPWLTVPNQTWQLVDNVSYTFGAHTLRFGGEFRRGVSDNLRNRRGKGRVRFQGGAAFGGDTDDPSDDSTPLEDFLAGAPAFGDIFVGSPKRHVTVNSFGAFAPDQRPGKPRPPLNYPTHA